MEYKNIKISHKAGKTIGIRTYSNDETSQTDEDRFPKQFEIFQQGETVGRETPLTPAKLEEGYYPIKEFKKLPPLMANFIRDGEEVEARTLLDDYEYIGSVEKDR